MIRHTSFARHFRHFNGTKAAALALAASCLLALASCDESLPPRDDPKNFLAVTVEPYYVSSRSGHALYLTIKVRNAYTETFSDTADVFGSIDLQWKDEPGMQKHWPLTGADIQPTYFDPVTNGWHTTRTTYAAASKILTIPENDMAVFQVKWNMVFGDTLAVANVVGFHPDPLQPPTMVSDVQTFIVTSGIHLFDKAPMMFPEPAIYRIRLIRPY